MRSRRVSEFWGFSLTLTTRALPLAASSWRRRAGRTWGGLRGRGDGEQGDHGGDGGEGADHAKRR